MKIKIALIILIFTTFVQAFSQQVNIIPQPSNLQINGSEFILDNDCSIWFDSKNLELVRIANFLNNFLKNNYGFHLKKNGKGKYIQFKIAELPALGSEGYHLKINENRIVISTDSPAGIFYGFQTFKQLLPLSGKATSLAIPGFEIEDSPRFSWRGNLLDVARHFFPISFLKKYIDILASYKLNVLQLHLTDDQGWRIEIKKYPKLTSVGGFRNGTIIGHLPGTDNSGQYYGGFYTQQQIKEIVKYAKDRFVTVIPEIEMPGHASAAIAAYPQLSCFPNESTKIPLQTPWAGSREGKQVQQTWGVFEDVYCPSEYTFEFLENVLDEVMKLFPSKYIHIGGDECPKAAWKRSEYCQKLIKGKGLKDEEELQGYFAPVWTNI